MKAATIQFRPVFKDKSANLRSLAKLVLEAARNGAKLIVLPELATTGYSFMSSQEARPFAENVHWLEDPTALSAETSLYIFSRLAQELDVSIVWGFLEVDPGTSKLYNSQMYYEASGYYEGYRKINFFASDYLWASRGISNPPVIKSQFEADKRIGMLICRDVRDKKDDNWKDFYAPGDADVVALSANWGKGGFPSSSWMDFVEENRTGLIVSNRYGVEGPNDFGDGGICIISPDGTVNCEGLRWGQDCIVYGEV